MFFKVKDLEVKKIHFDVIFPPGEIQYEEGLRQAAPLHAEGVAELLAHTLGEIRVQGRVQGKMVSPCDRCLEPAEFSIDEKFDLYYRPAADVEFDEEVEIDEGETEIAFYQGESLDLKEVLREFVLLSLPMQRTCREDCHGICPVCGQSRNLVSCGCEAKRTDDRWEALKKVQVRGI